MSKIADLLAIDKLQRIIKIIVDNGGIIRSFYKFWRFDTLKEGKEVGKDSFGNKYFMNDYYMMGRNRWVEHNPMVKWDYDATQITPEWFGWIHHQTDLLPHEEPAKQCLKCCCWTEAWMTPHEENLSGTDRAFYPYSTTRPHIKVWDGYCVTNRPDCASTPYCSQFYD